MQKKQLNISKSTQILTIMAILTAAQVVLGMLEIHTATIKISLSFIPVVIASRLYGGIGGALVAGVGDIASCIIHPVGAWYPPITITYAVIGLVYGLFLYKGDSFIRVLMSVGITQLIISLFITTIWISLLQYNTQDSMFFEFYLTKVSARLVQVLIMTAVQTAIIPPMLKAMEKIHFTKEIIGNRFDDVSPKKTAQPIKIEKEESPVYKTNN